MGNFSVEVRSNEPFEKALRRFTSKTRKTGLLRDLKKRRFYTQTLRAEEDQPPKEHSPTAEGRPDGRDRFCPRCTRCGRRRRARWCSSRSTLGSDRLVQSGKSDAPYMCKGRPV